MGCSAPVQGRAAKQVSIQDRSQCCPQAPSRAAGTPGVTSDGHHWAAPLQAVMHQENPANTPIPSFPWTNRKTLSKTKNNENGMAGPSLLLLSIFLLA